MKQAVNVAITGAAGQIGYALAFRVASGQMLGSGYAGQAASAGSHPGAARRSRAFSWSSPTARFPRSRSSSPPMIRKSPFATANVALLVGARPRGPGMERKDLLIANAQIFSRAGPRAR
jgi:malate dehydrogenase